MRNHYLFLILVTAITGCGPTSAYMPPPGAAVAPVMPGVHHRVERGQTLWRISKMYRVDLDDLAAANNIADTTKIETGQMIFIPNRQKTDLVAEKHAYDDFIWPLRGRVISTFGSNTGSIINKGLDIEPTSGTQVVASRSGRVVFYSDDFQNYGKTIILEHGDGFYTVYARNTQVMVRLGDKVQRGAAIATAGSAGRNKSTYLHFEIRKDHVPQNPYFYLP